MTKITLLLLAICSGCKDQTPPAPAPAPAALPASSPGVQTEVRIYDVPAVRQAELASVLREMHYPVQTVSATGTQTELVRLTPRFLGTGQMVISAPAAMHKGIAEVVEKVRSIPAANNAPVAEITFWFILAAPGADNLASIPELAAHRELLANYAPGNRFALIERLRVRTNLAEDARASLVGSAFSAEISPTLRGEQIYAQLTVSWPKQARPLITQLALKSGAITLLGEATFTWTSDLSRPEGFGENSPLLIAVQATQVAQ